MRTRQKAGTRHATTRQPSRCHRAPGGRSRQSDCGAKCWTRPNHGRNCRVISDLERAPQKRGWTPAGVGGGGQAVGFPAHAGMDTNIDTNPSERHGIPRTRGDGHPSCAGAADRAIRIPGHTGMARAICLSARRALPTSRARFSAEGSSRDSSSFPGPRLAQHALGKWLLRGLELRLRRASHARSVPRRRGQCGSRGPSRSDLVNDGGPERQRPGAPGLESAPQEGVDSQQGSQAANGTRA